MSARIRYSRARSGCGGASALMSHLVVPLAREETGGPSPAPVYATRRALGAPDMTRGATFVAIYEFDGYRPVVRETAFVHPQAAVTGNVVIGRAVLPQRNLPTPFESWDPFNEITL